MVRRLAIAVLTVLIGGAAHAEPEPQPAPRPRAGFDQKLCLGVRVAPLGLVFESESTFHYRFGPDDNWLLADAHLSIGPFVDVTPVMSAVGGVLEFQPAAFFVLRAKALRLDHFGTFGTLTTFDGLDADWSPERLSALEDADAGHVSSGLWLDLDAQLRAAIGNFVVTFNAHPMWLSADVDAPYYEPYNDILLAPDDLLLDFVAIAGWSFSPRLGDLVVAARWELMVGDAAEQPRHTLGAAVHWLIADGDGAVPGVSIDGMVGVYLEDRYRAGDPFAAVGVTVEWHK